MTRKKKTWIIIGGVFGTIFIAFIVVAIVLVIFSLPWTLIELDYYFQDEPPQPLASYGEFPFKFVYEYNGEIITIEDVLVIEYKGIYNSGGTKKNRWYYYLKNQTTIVYEHLATALFIEDGETSDQITLSRGYCFKLQLADQQNSICIYLGSCEYYMSVEEPSLNTYEEYGIVPGCVYCEIPPPINAKTSYCCKTLSHDQLNDQFGVKIIESSFSAPMREQNIGNSSLVPAMAQ